MTIKAVTAGEMREIDRVSIEETGIPAAVLMNNAGKALADFILNRFSGKNTVIFCGTGNNGGDGFTAAYYLFNRGVKPVIYMSGTRDRLSETSRIFLNLCEKMSIIIYEISAENIHEIMVPPESLIVDAVLGTGFTGTPEGIPGEFIRIINSSRGIIISVDIPSGLSSDGDEPDGDFVRADYTITIGLPKISLVTYPCRQYCGEVIIEDIGFPHVLTNSDKLKAGLIDDSLFRSWIAAGTDPDTHKGERGHILMIGGFKNMEGAAILAASAMFRTGCGLVTIATMNESRGIIAGKIPESMTYSLPENPDSAELKEFMTDKKFTSMVIGPGLGRSPYSEKIFTAMLKHAVDAGIKKILIDGDGLYHLASYLEKGRLPAGTDFVITPHFMEASRIMKKEIKLIKKNRLVSCRELAILTGCTAVLKGPATIVSDGDISFINTTGNSSLATAGSGDVLSGIIGALLNRELSTAEAAAAGVFIHGFCADIFAADNGPGTMSASDIINAIRHAINLKIAINEPSV